MEDTLRVPAYKADENGAMIVLILILMEDTLRGVIMKANLENLKES